METNLARRSAAVGGAGAQPQHVEVGNPPEFFKRPVRSGLPGSPRLAALY